MMKLQVFSVYDSAAEAYLPPVVMNSSGEMVRAFDDAVNNPEHQFARHPEDYTLFHVGEFDQLTGRLEALAAPVSLGVAVQYVKRPRLAAEGGV